MSNNSNTRGQPAGGRRSSPVRHSPGRGKTRASVAAQPPHQLHQHRQLQQHMDEPHGQNPHDNVSSGAQVAPNIIEDDFDVFGSEALNDFEQSQSQVRKPQPRQAERFDSQSQSVGGPGLNTTMATGSNRAVPTTGETGSSSSHNPDVPADSIATQLLKEQLREAQEKIETLTGEVLNVRSNLEQKCRETQTIQIDLNSWKNAYDVKIAQKDSELRKMDHDLSFQKKEKQDEIDRRVAVEQKFEAFKLQRQSSPGASSSSPPMPPRSKRPHPLNTSTSTKSDFPTTRTFLGSSNMTTSTPINSPPTAESRLPAKESHHLAKSSLLSKAAAKMENITPIYSPHIATPGTGGSSVKITPNQTPTKGSLSLGDPPASFFASFRSVVIPEDEAYPLFVEEAKDYPVIPAHELLQRLIECGGDQGRIQDSSSTHAVASLTDSTPDDPTKLEGNSPNARTSASDSTTSEGILSLLTCTNPMYEATTGHRTTPSALWLAKKATKIGSTASRASIAPMHRAALSGEQRKRLHDSRITSECSSHAGVDSREDSSGSSSSDSSIRVLSCTSKINPLLLGRVSQQKLQGCIRAMLAPAGTPMGLTVSEDTSSSLPLSSNLSSPRSTVVVEDDGGLCLLEFLQLQIMSYFDEYGQAGSLFDGAVSSSSAESSSSSETSSGSLSVRSRPPPLSRSTKSTSQTSGPMLQFLRVLCTLVKYSAAAREKLHEPPPKLDCGGRPLGGSETESLTSGSCPSDESMRTVSSEGTETVESMSQKTSSISDPSSSSSSSSLSRVEMDIQSSSGSGLSPPEGQGVVALVPCVLSTVEGRKMASSAVVEGVYLEATPPGAASGHRAQEPSVDLSKMSRVIEGVKFNSKFFPFLVNLLRHPWCRDPSVCECVLEILYHTARDSSVRGLERFRGLLTGPVPLLYSCLRHTHLAAPVVVGVARLLNALVPMERITDVICSKSEMCVLLQLYNVLSDFELPDPQIPLYIQRLFCSLVARTKEGLQCLFLSECCHCSIKAFHCLLSNVSYRFPIEDVSRLPHVLYVLFKDFVAFVDCISDRVLNSGSSNCLIFVVHSLYNVFLSQPGCSKEVEILEGFQESEVSHSTEVDLMETSGV